MAALCGFAPHRELVHQTLGWGPDVTPEHANSSRSKLKLPESIKMTANARQWNDGIDQRQVRFCSTSIRPMIRGQNVSVEGDGQEVSKAKAYSSSETTFRIEDIVANAPVGPPVPCHVDDNAKSKGRTIRASSRIRATRVFHALLVAIALRLLLALRPRPATGPVRSAGPLRLRPRRRRRNYSMVPQPGEYAPLATSTTADPTPPLHDLQTSPTSKYHVFVLHSAAPQQQSPILVNLLMGLLDHTDDHVAFVTYNEGMGDFQTRQNNQYVYNNATVVSHTIETELSALQRAFRKDYEHLFFVTMENILPECAVPPENLLCLENSELYYERNEDASREAMVSRVVGRFRNAFSYFSNVLLDDSIQRIVKRLRAMQRMTLHMHDVPSSTFETKYGIYGALT